MLFSWMYDTIRNHSFTVQIPHPFDLLYDVIRSWLIFNPRLRYSFKNILVMMFTWALYIVFYHRLLAFA